MSPPVPTPVVWTTPLYTPIATAMPTPVSTPPTATPCPEGSRLAYPSIYLFGHAVTFTCPSTVCRPICEQISNSTNIFDGALKSIHNILFGKGSKASTNNIIVTPTRALPAFKTLSAPDIIGTHFLFVPQSYPLWSPWVEDPILKFGVIYTWSVAKFETWTALKNLGTFNFIKKYRPVVNTFGPYIRYKALPLLFKQGTRAVWHLLSLISEALVELEDDLANGLEHAAHIFTYVNSFVSALTFHQFLTVTSLLLPVCLWTIWNRRCNDLREEVLFLHARVNVIIQRANEEFDLIREDAAERRNVSAAWFKHLSTEIAKLNQDIRTGVQLVNREFSAVRETAAEDRKVSMNWFDHLSAENASRHQDLQRAVQWVYQELSTVRKTAEEHRQASVNWFKYLSAENLKRQQDLRRRAQWAQKDLTAIWTAGTQHRDAILLLQDRADRTDDWLNYLNDENMMRQQDLQLRVRWAQQEFEAIWTAGTQYRDAILLLEGRADRTDDWLNHLNAENMMRQQDFQFRVQWAQQEFDAIWTAGTQHRDAILLLEGRADHTDDWLNHLNAENMMRQQDLQLRVQWAQQEFDAIWTTGTQHRDAILLLQGRTDRTDEAVVAVMAAQDATAERIDNVEAWVHAHNGMINQLHRDTVNQFGIVQGQIDTLRDDQDATQGRVHIVEKQVDIGRKYVLQLERDNRSNFRFVLGRIYEISTAVEANNTDIRSQGDVINSFGRRVSDLETHSIATDSSIWVIRQELVGVKEQIDAALKQIGNAQEQFDTFKKRIGNVDQQVHNSDKLITKILKLVNESSREAKDAQTQAKGFTEQLRAVQKSIGEFKEWTTDANDKFQKVYREIAKMSMGLASLKMCSTPHKDHLIQLYDKVCPEFAEKLMDSYTFLNQQPGSVIKAEVLLGKTMQNALVRAIGEKYTSALVQSGEIKEQLATLQGQVTRLRALLPADQGYSSFVRDQVAALQEQVTGLQEFARIGADVHNLLADAQVSLEDRVEDSVPEQDLMPAPLKVQKKQPAANFPQDLGASSGDVSSAEALTDELLAELEVA